VAPTFDRVSFGLSLHHGEGARERAAGAVPAARDPRLDAFDGGERPSAEIRRPQRMRALTLVADRKVELVELDPPPAPAAGEVQVRVKAVALNHIDLWGYRGMAFAKRKLPLAVGAEAAGEVAAVGPGVASLKPGDAVVMYGAQTCGVCTACREGRDNLCEEVRGIMGFHVDGFAREYVNMPERLVIKVPAGVAMRDAACAPIAYSTVEHMLFDNARLRPGETILVHAGGSGIGTVAVMMAKALGCTVITTVGDDGKAEKVKALGADHVINYRRDRFETIVRKLTAKKGVDVVFEHVGAETFNGSLLCLKRGGRLVTCGATSGPAVTFNLMQLFQQQYRIVGSFGASMRNIRDGLAKMAAGMRPVIDTEVSLADFERGLARLEGRQVFGKVIMTL
jgi:alcohol dehydrogenase